MPRGIYPRTEKHLDFIKRVGYANRGRKHTPETREKVSARESRLIIEVGREAFLPKKEEERKQAMPML